MSSAPEQQEGAAADAAAVDVVERELLGEGMKAAILANPDTALNAALAAAQANFPPIEKRNTAEVRGKDGKPGYTYTYADLGDVLAAVRPVLARNGLSITQRTKHLQDGKVLLTTELRHIAGGVLDSEIHVGQSPANPQQFGGALTYLRRYEVVALLGIAAEEDRDAQDVDVPGRQAPAAELPVWAKAATEERKRELVAVLEPIVGRPRALAFGKSVAESWGVLPDGIVGAVKALAVHIGAERARQAQDAAAEQPDPPAPEEVDAEVPPPDAGVPEDAPLDDLPPAGSVDQPEFADEEIHAARGGDESARKLIGDAMRSAGCTCVDPVGLTLGESEGTDDGCPLRGHGIPF